MRAVLSLSSLGFGVAVVLCACAGGGSGPVGFAGPDAGGGGTGSASSSSSSGGGAGTASSSGAGSGSGTGSSSGNLVGDGGEQEGGLTGDPTTCAAAASSHSYIGCDYWPTVTANNVWSIFDFAVVVANAGSDKADITVTGPGNPPTSVTATVAPQQLTKIYLPWVGPLKGPDSDNCGNATPLSSSVLARGAAYHLVSTAPVTVYQFNALEYVGQGGPQGKSWSSCPGDTQCNPPPPYAPYTVGCYSFSNDASLLLPSTAMTGNYRVAGHGGWGTTSQPVMGAYAAITATQDGTTVNVKVSATGSVSAGGGIAATSAGGLLTLQMNAGDVAELVGDKVDTSDLTGSLVQATKPVQVITGVPCLDLPDNAPACDHVEESNLPAETLGQDYVVVQPPAPNGSPVGHQVRIVGNVDGTHLTYVPSAPAGCPATIDAGQVVDCGGPVTQSLCPDPTTGNATGGSCGAGNVVGTDFEVKGDNAFAVTTLTQGASMVDPNTQAPNQQGDPDESMAVAVAQYRTDYVFLAPSDYEASFATVIAPSGTSVSIDGQDQTVPPPSVGTYSVLRVKLGAGNSGAHTLHASSPVALEVTGYGSYTDYTYPGGLDLKYIAPPPPPAN